MFQMRTLILFSIFFLHWYINDSDGRCNFVHSNFAPSATSSAIGRLTRDFPKWVRRGSVAVADCRTHKNDLAGILGAVPDFVRRCVEGLVSGIGHVKRNLPSRISSNLAGNDCNLKLVIERIVCYGFTRTLLPFTNTRKNLKCWNGTWAFYANQQFWLLWKGCYSLNEGSNSAFDTSSPAKWSFSSVVLPDNVMGPRKFLVSMFPFHWLLSSWL